MKTITFNVSGMSCGGCTGKVERTLSQMEGVSHVEVSLHPGMATVQADPALVTPEKIESALTKLGFESKVRPT